MSLSRWLDLSRYSKRRLFFLGILSVLFVGLIDYLTGPEIDVTIFYFPPIIFFSRYFGRSYGFLIAFLCAILWFSSDIFSGHVYSHPFAPFWNGLVRLLIFLLISVMLSNLQLEIRRPQDQIVKLRKESDEIQRLADIKSQFADTVSHELRTPLTAMKESLGIVRDGAAGAILPEQKEFLEIALRNLERLSRLINCVLDFEKLESGQQAFKMEWGNLNEVVREVEKEFIPLAQLKGLKLALELDGNLPRLRFDKDRLIQVLINFINNAVKFSDKGRITIKTKRNGGEVHVSVSDQGIGIKKEDLSRLFESFSQVSGTGGKRERGTGLGLAISKKIVEAHRGRIWVESVHGKGSAFYFSLPGAIHG